MHLQHPLSPTRVDEGLRDTLRTLKEQRNDRSQTAAVPTGFTTLDEALGGGVRRGELTVVAGRSGLGTTVLVLGLSRLAALRHRLGVLAIAPDQDALDLHVQMLSAEARVPLNQLRYGPLSAHSWPKIVRCAERLETAHLWIDTTPAPTAADVADAVERIDADHPLALVVVDGLESLHDTGFSRDCHANLGRPAERLRALARRRNLAVVVTSRLNGSPRPDHYPTLADLPDRHDVGGLDAVADTVLLLHREDVYDPHTLRPGEADIIVAKNRGPTHAVGVHFQGHYAKVVDPPM